MLKEFFVKNAKYKIKDSKGNLLILYLDYWKSEYKIEIRKGILKKETEKEIEKIRKHLLGNKSRKNLSVKLRKSGVIK